MRTYTPRCTLHNHVHNRKYVALSVSISVKDECCEAEAANDRIEQAESVSTYSPPTYPCIKPLSDIASTRGRCVL